MYVHEAANELNRFIEGNQEEVEAYLAGLNLANRYGNPEFTDPPWPEEEVIAMKQSVFFEYEDTALELRKLWKQLIDIKRDVGSKKRHPQETIDNDTPEWMIFCDEMLSDPTHYKDLRLRAKAARNREVVDETMRRIAKEAETTTEDIFSRVRQKGMPFKI